MSEQMINFPKARAAFGAGDLQDVYDVNLAATDGRKLVSTLRRNPAGWTDGSRSTNLTLKSAISADGFERSYLKTWQKGDVVQIRIKVPGQTLVVEGVLTNPIVTANVDNFIDFTISILGAFGFD